MMSQNIELSETKPLPPNATEPASDSEGGIEEYSDGSPSPGNGGFNAWLSVVGGFFVFVNTWGLTASFGAFQSYYTTDLLAGASSSKISWIGSIQSFLVVSIGVIGGPLFDRGYIRPVLFIGWFLIAFGMMMVSLCKTYTQLVLVQGICIGLGAGLIYTPTLAIMSTQFTTRRPFAIGCASSGASIGGIIFPIMFRKLQPRIGFGWTVRSIAFINLSTLLVSLLILSRYKSPKPKTTRTLLDLRAFSEVPFTTFAVSLIFIFLAFYIPLFFIPSYAIYNLGCNHDFASYLLSILNAGSFFGRILPLLVANRVGAMKVLFFWTVAAAIVMFSWLGIQSVSGFIVFCTVWGFISGVLVTAPTPSISHPTISPSMSVIGTRMGMCWITASIGILIGPPIGGALVDLKNADFVKAIAFSGAMLGGGGICLIAPVVAAIRYRPEATTT